MSPRNRWLLQPLSWQRGGALALVVLVVVAAAALVLDADAGGEHDAIVERLAGDELDPADRVVELARGARILILADVPGRASPKRLAADVIARLSSGTGLDAVVLEVPSSEQRYIDAYLAGSGDASALLSRSAAVHEWEGMPREYLRIYEAVRSVNEGVSPSRRIRIIAADLENWPPQGAAPQEMGDLYARRAEHMLNRIDREVFTIMPDARILVFVDGYMSLQGTHGALRFGGREPVRIEWLGELLRRRSGSGARTVLVDAGSASVGAHAVPSYRGTRLQRPLRRELSGPAGARVTGELAEVTDPVLELSTPGLRLDVRPEGYSLGDAAQGYIFLPGGR